MIRFTTLAALFLTCSLAAAADFPDISHADLVTAIKAKTVTILDVNGTTSYEKAHIPGALDFEALGDTLADKLPDDTSALIVAYCGGPKCGAWKYGARAAAKLGYTNVKHYSAGISGWKASDEGKAKQTSTKNACEACTPAKQAACGTCTPAKKAGCSSCTHS